VAARRRAGLPEPSLAINWPSPSQILACLDADGSSGRACPLVRCWRPFAYYLIAYALLCLGLATAIGGGVGVGQPALRLAAALFVVGALTPLPVLLRLRPLHWSLTADGEGLRLHGGGCTSEMIDWHAVQAVTVKGRTACLETDDGDLMVDLRERQAEGIVAAARLVCGARQGA